MRYLLDEFDVAGMLQIHVREVKALVQTGVIPHVPFPSGEVRFIEPEVWQWARSRMQPSHPEAVVNGTG